VSRLEARCRGGSGGRTGGQARPGPNLALSLMSNPRKSALKPPAIDWRAVARRLRELRGFDTNQAAFARALGISQAQMSRYEKGKSEMVAEVVLRISRRFGKSMEWVLTGEEK